MPNFAVNVPVFSQIPIITGHLNGLIRVVGTLTSRIEKSQKSLDAIGDSSGERIRARAIEAQDTMEITRNAFRAAVFEVEQENRILEKRGAALLGPRTGAIQQEFEVQRRIAAMEKAASEIEEPIGLDRTKAEMAKYRLELETRTNELLNGRTRIEQMQLAFARTGVNLVAERVALGQELDTQGRSILTLTDIENAKVQKILEARREEAGIRKRVAEIAITDPEFQAAEGKVAKRGMLTPSGRETKAAKTMRLRLEGIRLGVIERDTELKNIKAQEETTKNLQMEVEERERLSKQYAMTKGLHLDVARSHIQMASAAGMSNKAIAEEISAHQAANNAARRHRAELINASIGMFVFTITATQTIAALQGMTKEGSVANFTFGEMTRIIKLTTGPIQVFTGVLQFMNQANKELMKSMSLWLGVALAGAFIIRGFTTDSKKLQRVYFSLALAISALTAAYSAYRIMAIQTTMANTGLATSQAAVNVQTAAGIPVTIASAFAEATKAKFTWSVFFASIAKLSIPTLGASLAFAAGVIGVIASMVGIVKSFQTQPGEFKRVGKGGLAQVHEGETIYRPASIGAQGRMGAGGMGSSVINYNFFVRGDLDTNAVKMMNRQLRAGQIGVF